ncbi:hypothetical protein LXL04_011553 [Taraxacum kok-saghyz]
MCMALLSFKALRVPKDKEHPYGHGKFETLGALGISGVLLNIFASSGVLSAASDIANQESHSHIGHEIDMNHPVIALNTTIVAIVVKEGYVYPNPLSCFQFYCHICMSSIRRWKNFTVEHEEIEAKNQEV